MPTAIRPFIEKLFAAYAKGDIDLFFQYFDPNVQWTIHGEHLFAGNYKSIKEIRSAYNRFNDLLKDKPKQTLRYLVVEGTKATAFLYDEVVGKDGKRYELDYWLLLELSPDGKKVVRVDHYMDTHQILKLLKATTKNRLVA